jgi:Domain of unknown function (DUF4926)
LSATTDSARRPARRHTRRIARFYPQRSADCPHFLGVSDAVELREEHDMTLELYTDAALTCDVPEHRLKRGDIVKLIDHHVAPDGTEGYSIEVFNAVGDTIAVTAVPSTALEPLREDEILCARSMNG